MRIQCESREILTQGQPGPIPCTFWVQCCVVSIDWSLSKMVIKHKCPFELFSFAHFLTFWLMTYYLNHLRPVQGYFFIFSHKRPLLVHFEKCQFITVLLSLKYFSEKELLSENFLHEGATFDSLPHPTHPSPTH